MATNTTTTFNTNAPAFVPGMLYHGQLPQQQQQQQSQQWHKSKPRSKPKNKNKTQKQKLQDEMQMVQPQPSSRRNRQQRPTVSDFIFATFQQNVKVTMPIVLHRYRIKKINELSSIKKPKGKQRENPKPKRLTHAKQSVQPEKEKDLVYWGTSPVKLILNHPEKMQDMRYPREYCYQIMSKQLDSQVAHLLKTLLRFQLRSRTKLGMVPKLKRRIIVGLKEVKRSLQLNKALAVVVAANIQMELEGATDGVRKQLAIIIEQCQIHQVPVIFSSTRKQLANQLGSRGVISIIAIQNFEGCDVEFTQVINFSQTLQNTFTKEFCKQPTKVNSLGQTPLWLACCHGYAHLIPTLLAIPGVDRNCVDNSGISAKDIALKNHHAQAAALLL